MADLTSRDIVERYMSAMPGDQTTLRVLRHADFIEEWPQTGERVRGAERMAQIDAHYPGGMPGGAVERIVGSEDRWVMTPSFTLVRIAGAGDTYTAVARAMYPDGSRWFVVSLIEVRDAKILKATTFFASDLEAPAWRANWVEPIA